MRYDIKAHWIAKYCIVKHERGGLQLTKSENSTS